MAECRKFTVVDPESVSTEEEKRLVLDARREANWKRWGKYHLC